MSDLISRQAAMDALDKQCDIVCQYSKKQRSVMCGACPLGTAFDVIEELPSAAPERKTGRWIYEGKRGRFPACRCSECGNVENADWAILGDNVNFCPNCGAYMIEVKEAEK